MRWLARLQGPVFLTSIYLERRSDRLIDYSSHHNEMRFAYDEAYLESADAVALSYALPLQCEAFDSDSTTIFFENLLPPDQVRKKIGPILHISHHNVFGFLKALGGDCAGAISLWPYGHKPDSGEEQVKRLDDEAAAVVLGSLRKRPLYVNGIDGYRISGAGAQNKLIARRWAYRASAVWRSVDAHNKAARSGLR